MFVYFLDPLKAWGLYIFKLIEQRYLKREGNQRVEEELFENPLRTAH